MTTTAGKTPGKVVAKSARAAAGTAKRATANPWLQRATRLGYVIRGCLYGTVGILVFRAAAGWQGNTQDLRGSLILLPTGPLRTVLLLTLIVGLFSYGLWGFVRAIYDPLNRGNDPAGLAARVGFAWSGMNYLLLVVFAMAFLVGASNTDGSDNMYRAVSAVMSHPGGWVALIIAGVIGTLSGLGQFVDAYKAGFRKDLKRAQMSKTQRNTVDSLGRFGMMSRGVVFTMLGWFILQAGLSRDASRSESMRAVFRTLGDLPLGHVLLAVVALGLLALALHSCACARWVRMPQRS